MLLATINQAIYDRIKADTGSGGLYKSGAWSIISGAYSVFGSPNPMVFPYLLWSIRMEQDHSLPADEFNVTATFTVYDQIQDYVTSSEYHARVTSVLDRLHGNAVLQNGRVPTYGFHRHLLVLPTNGYTAQASHCFVRSYDSSMVDEHTVTGTMSMTFRVSALASNP
jgi:hypothetical protein